MFNLIHISQIPSYGHHRFQLSADKTMNGYKIYIYLLLPPKVNKTTFISKLVYS